MYSLNSLFLGLRARELRQQLESLGISTSGCLDRESLVELLETEGRRVLLGEGPSRASSRADLRMEELRRLRLRDLRRELDKLGLDTLGRVDRESLLELLEDRGREALEQAREQPPAEQEPKQEPEQEEKQQQQQNPFMDAKPPPVAAEPERGGAEAKIYLMRAVSDHGFKTKAKVITVDLEVGCSPLRFVLDTACN